MSAKPWLLLFLAVGVLSSRPSVCRSADDDGAPAAALGGAARQDDYEDPADDPLERWNEDDRQDRVDEKNEARQLKDIDKRIDKRFEGDKPKTDE
jgi:hypothetical protein